MRYKGRASRRITGRGAYFGQKAGELVGRLTGFTGLGRLGSDLEDRVLRHYKGKGAYKSNALMNPTKRSARTRASSGGGADCPTVTFTNREYVRDITGSTTFKIDNWLINPGIAQQFPWLSQIALNYEEFEFEQLIYTYKSLTPSVSVGTPHTTWGSGYGSHL
jgi:Viral coat protein (S domain)